MFAVLLKMYRPFNPPLWLGLLLQDLLYAAFFACPVLLLAGLITGIRERTHPLARVSILVSVAALVLFVIAVVWPVFFTPVVERA